LTGIFALLSIFIELPMVSVSRVREATVQLRIAKKSKTGYNSGVGKTGLRLASRVPVRCAAFRFPLAWGKAAKSIVVQGVHFVKYTSEPWLPLYRPLKSIKRPYVFHRFCVLI
jgi:hypothetical protein